MQVTISEVETNLSVLIDAALAGEEVVIAKGKHPVVRLVPVSQEKFTHSGLQKASSANFVPMSEDDLALWEELNETHPARYSCMGMAANDGAVDHVPPVVGQPEID